MEKENQTEGKKNKRIDESETQLKNIQIQKVNENEKRKKMMK